MCSKCESGSGRRVTDPAALTPGSGRRDDDEQHELDTRGQRCPYPVIELGQLWSELRREPGEHRITITADDPVAIIDIPAWCDIKGAHCTRLDDGSTRDIVYRVEFVGADEA